MSQRKNAILGLLAVIPLLVCTCKISMRKGENIGAVAIEGKTFVVFSTGIMIYRDETGRGDSQTVKIHCNATKKQISYDLQSAPDQLLSLTRSEAAACNKFFNQQTREK